MYQRRPNNQKKRTSVSLFRPASPPLPLEHRLPSPPSLFIIRLLICWLVIKLILRLVKLMHWYHRALITHGTLSATISTRAQPFSRATPDSNEVRGTLLSAIPYLRRCRLHYLLTSLLIISTTRASRWRHRDKCILLEDAQPKLYLMITTRCFD